MANYVAKKSPDCLGVFDLETRGPPDQSALLTKIPVGEVWGIGFRTERRLLQMGIHTVADLQSSSPKHLRKQFGVVVERIVAELNGEVCTDLEISPPAKQQIRSSRSFGRAVTELSVLKEAMLAFVSIAAEKLRRQNSLTSTLQVFVCTNAFRPDKPQHSNGFTLNLPYATDETTMLGKFAVRTLDQLYKPGYEYKKAGVNLINLSPRVSAQMDLFTNSNSAKRGERLSNTMDTINQRFGRESICLGRVSGIRSWSMNQARLSPCYTTNKNQLLLVR